MSGFQRQMRLWLWQRLTGAALSQRNAQVMPQMGIFWAVVSGEDPARGKVSWCHSPASFCAVQRPHSINHGRGKTYKGKKRKEGKKEKMKKTILFLFPKQQK